MKMNEYEEAQKLMQLVPRQGVQLNFLSLGYKSGGAMYHLDQSFPSIVVDQALQQAIGPLEVEYARNVKRLLQLIPDWDNIKREV